MLEKTLRLISKLETRLKSLGNSNNDINAVQSVDYYFIRILSLGLILGGSGGEACFRNEKRKTKQCR